MSRIPRTLPSISNPQEYQPTELISPLRDLVPLPESKLLDSIGVSPAYVINEYMKIVNQDDDLSNKLKSLKPLVKELGIDIDGSEKAGITNNIIVMPQQIVEKYKLSSSVIEADLPTPPSEDVPRETPPI